MLKNINCPANRTTQGAKKSNSLTADSGKKAWKVKRYVHEIGGPHQREDTKTFASQEDAKAYFADQASTFRNMMGRLTDASIKQSETELLIHIGGVQIVKMSYLSVPLQCA